MKITYIDHSCFVVELKQSILIFDYYKGELPAFDEEKAIFVFVSHKHYDHFNMKIFSMLEQYKKVHYILAGDMKMTDKYMERHHILQYKSLIEYLPKNSKNNLSIAETCLEVETLTSTDEGVAYIISAEDQSIYHAGDLNWWSWKGESETEYEDMKNRFVWEMKKLEKREFDVAFLVLDPRQEERFWWGFDYFMRTTNTKRAIPMHCWGDYSVIPKLLSMECSIPYRNKVESLCGMY